MRSPYDEVNLRYCSFIIAQEQEKGKWEQINGINLDIFITFSKMKSWNV